MLAHPEVAWRDCQHCQKYVYDVDTGELFTDRQGPYPRPLGNFAPCRTPGQSCPKGTPEESNALSEQNLQAWRHYKRSKAVGFVDDEKRDPIVFRNAGIIAANEEAFARQQAAGLQHSILRLASVSSIPS